MNNGVVVVGAGGFGRETLDVLLAVASTTSSLELIGVIDDEPSEANRVRLYDRGITFLGPIAPWLRTRTTSHYVVAIGSPIVRRSVAAQFDAAGCSATSLVHPSACIGSAVTINPGAVICAGVVVATNVTLGRHAHLNANCTIGHDTTIGEFVSVNPGAVVSGDCVIHDSALIGAGSTVLQGRVIGEASTVGASACVVRDVDPKTVVKGVPAR